MKTKKALTVICAAVLAAISVAVLLYVNVDTNPKEHESLIYTPEEEHTVKTVILDEASVSLTEMLDNKCILYIGNINEGTICCVTADFDEYGGYVNKSAVFYDTDNNTLLGTSVLSDNAEYYNAVSGHFFVAEKALTENAMVYDYSFDGTLQNSFVYNEGFSADKYFEEYMETYYPDFEADTEELSDEKKKKEISQIKENSGRDISEYYRVNEFEQLLTYHLSALFVLLLSVYCASNLFAGEKETQMLSLIKCSPKGEKDLFLAKAFSLAAFCVAVGVIFFSTDLFVFWVCRRPSGFLLPIYAIESFTYTPLNINIVAFFVLISFLKIFGAFIVGVAAILFSVFFSKSYQAFVAGFLSVIALMGINLFTDGFFGIVRYFNPVTMFISVRLFETLRLENLLGYPVYMYALSFVGTLIFGCIFLFLSYRLYTRRHNNA